jgi:hypothetical protein
MLEKRLVECQKEADYYKRKLTTMRFNGFDESHENDSYYNDLYTKYSIVSSKITKILDAILLIERNE